MVVLKDITKVKKLLKSYNDFQECIIEELVFKEQLTIMIVSIINIWTNTGQIRSDIDTRKEIVKLQFNGLKSLSITNDLNIKNDAYKERINWSYNEFALIEVGQEIKSQLKISFVWESNRRIEVICDSINQID